MIATILWTVEIKRTIFITFLLYFLINKWDVFLIHEIKGRRK